MTYRLLVLMHIAFVMLFVGNLVAAWLIWSRARAVREPATLAALYDVVNTGDRWLTPLPVVGIITSGILIARMQNLTILGSGWIFWSLVALGVSGVIYATRLAGLQRELAASASGPFDLLACRHRLAQWGFWAAAATAAIAAAIALMVVRPPLPGL